MTNSALVKVIVPLTFMLAVAVSPHLAADSYPSRPIKLITGGAPGSVTDSVGRPLAEELARRVGQPVVIDNRPGAGGISAIDAVVKASPDGYTLGIATVSQMASNPHLFAKLSYDPLRDLTPVVRLVAGQMVLAAHPSFPPNSLDELVAFAKSRPGQINYAIPNIGSPPHLLALMLCQSAGVDMREVPFRSAQEALGSVLSGDVPVLVDAPLIVAQHVKSGTLKALAVSSSYRSPLLPETPSFAEAGFAGYGQEPWIGIVAPAATPQTVVRRLASEIQQALSAGDLKRRYESQGWRVVGDPPEQFANIIKEDHATWGSVIRKSGLKLD
jgi:tripartite-type tricarboxylate transporter receptor subunit TctC